MSRRTLTFGYFDAPPPSGLAPIVARLRLIRSDLRECLSGAALTVTGYLRRRPDPAIEHMLRTTFAELDRELAEILGDRPPYDIRDSA